MRVWSGGGQSFPGRADQRWACRRARHITITVRPLVLLEELPFLSEEFEHLRGGERALPVALGGRLCVKLVLRAGAQRGGPVARWQGRGCNGLR